MGPTDLLSDSGEFTQQKEDCIIGSFGFSNSAPRSRKKPVVAVSALIGKSARLRILGRLCPRVQHMSRAYI
jgi:hypothetical protein